MNSDNRRFRRGSGSYKCADCGKMTRETGGGESDCGLCADCLHESELINLVSDGGWDELAKLAEQNPGIKLMELAKRLETAIPENHFSAGITGQAERAYYDDNPPF